MSNKIKIAPELLLLLGVSLFLNFWGLTRGLPNVVDWDPDSIAPMGPLVYAKRMLYGEPWWNKYPSFHFSLSALSFAPYLGWLRFSGGLQAPRDSYPYGLIHPEAALSVFIFISRSLSALMAVGVVWIVYRITAEIFDRRAGFFAGFLFACSPLTVYYSHTGNLDIPYLFWSALAVWSFVRLLSEPALKYFVSLGSCVALAIATKDQAYGLFVFVPFALAILAMGGRLACETRTFWRRAIAGFACTVLVYLIAGNVLLNPAGWFAHFHYITGPGAAHYQVYASSPFGYLELGARTLSRLINALNVPIFLCCLSGLLYATERRQTLALLIPFVSYTVTFIGIVLYVYPRFVLPLIFLLAPFGGRLLAGLWEIPGKNSRRFVMSILVYSFIYGFSIDLQFTYDARYQAEQWLAAHLPAGAVVGTDAQRAYLPRLPHGIRAIKVKITKNGVQTRNGEQPNFLILSEAHYRRYKASRLTEPEQKIIALLRESLTYEMVVAFDDKLDDFPFLAAHFLPYASPTIIILKQF